MTTDGTHFTDHQVVLRQIETFSPQKGIAGYSTPSPIAHEGTIHLFHDVAHFDKKANPSWRQIALAHAQSKDGITFTQQPAAIATCDSLPWTQSEIRSPSVIMHKGQAHMWFAGHGDLRKIINDLTTGKRGLEFGIDHAVAEKL